MDSDKLMKLNVQEIKERFDYDLMEHLTAEERATLSSGDTDKVLVMHGKDFDLKKVGIKKHVPDTSDFMIYEYRTRIVGGGSWNIIRHLHCTHEGC